MRLDLPLSTLPTNAIRNVRTPLLSSSGLSPASDEAPVAGCGKGVAIVVVTGLEVVVDALIGLALPETKVYDPTKYNTRRVAWAR